MALALALPLPLTLLVLPPLVLVLLLLARVPMQDAAFVVPGAEADAPAAADVDADGCEGGGGTGGAGGDGGDGALLKFRRVQAALVRLVASLYRPLSLEGPVTSKLQC